MQFILFCALFLQNQNYIITFPRFCEFLLNAEVYLSIHACVHQEFLSVGI